MSDLFNDRSCSSDEEHSASHPKACAENVYRDAFRNECGDVFHVEIDRRTKTGVLTGSDIGKSIRIINNRVRGGLILGLDEFEWLAAAWRISTGEELNPSCCLAAVFKLAREQGLLGDSP